MKSFFRNFIKKLDRRHKNNKVAYYLRAYWAQLMPRSFYEKRLDNFLRNNNQPFGDYIKNRVNYYNKLPKTDLHESALPIGDLKKSNRQRTYFYDAYEYLRYFNPSLKASILFGDITKIPSVPSLVKSRPIQTDNVNSVLLKLDKVRHFAYVKDPHPFQKKKDMLLGRGAIKQPHRIEFYEKYFNHPMCNLGAINKQANPIWITEQLSVAMHLHYKFILCLEGNDVASNLKWVMSSNSLAVMPKPKFETWFMEDKLIPDYHYVSIKDDYSNLEERLQYYIKHQDEAIAISKNANEYVRQFNDEEKERLISLLVLEKYFYMTGQGSRIDPSSYLD